MRAVVVTLDTMSSLLKTSLSLLFGALAILPILALSLALSASGQNPEIMRTLVSVFVVLWGAGYLTLIVLGGYSFMVVRRYVDRNWLERRFLVMFTFSPLSLAIIFVKVAFDLSLPDAVNIGALLAFGMAQVLSMGVLSEVFVHAIEIRSENLSAA